ncbi:SUMF1/EgtB/PvdO family nonheme iron enzyme [Gluconobacter wancherniae]|uniref:formylglycine-generating enzyme family protein n=1 Tax=Gluconobacter wancherniae TaxID=1307955 RepID=UPI001B8ABDDE|nr:SUMF1/EgtB/PvdO family nonheme iron enzyme [Gluconobacter wancherniae]MBS1063862.1 SUMF1/EgtB/PvdO family nonheme iron enzyme [Gluconobacter wancherniae]
MSNLYVGGRDLISRFGDQPLVWKADGTSLTVHQAYIPLLVSYTQEDMEAKGLRRLEDPTAPRPPVHFTALEMVVKERGCLLFGDTGSGKTSFSLDLALNLAGASVMDSRYGLAALTRTVARNAEGIRQQEKWIGPAPMPVLCRVENGQNCEEVLSTLADKGLLETNTLLIFDGLEKCSDYETFLQAAAGLLSMHSTLRVVVLADGYLCRGLSVPDAFAPFSLIGLNRQQKIDALLRHGCRVEPDIMPARPDLFVAAAVVGWTGDDDPITIVDAWLSAQSTERRVALAAAALSDGLSANPDKLIASDFARTALFPVLAARAFSMLPEHDVLARIAHAPIRWRSMIPLLTDILHKRGEQTTELARGLLELSDPWAVGALSGAALCLASVGNDDLIPSARRALVTMIEGGGVTLVLRDQAARYLAMLGDPRTLDALISVPAGRSVIGSDTHPNSQPVHVVTLSAYRISQYPVTVAAYGAFARETGRAWCSPDAVSTERANAPATDLTWYDACAYCVWLTRRWRAEGHIAPDDVVRLPTEVEWERAARGDQADVSGDVLYPWMGPWMPGRSNSGELGLNSSVAVGLCPNGRSPYGVDDMAGNIWEWTTTLWGPDMALPDFLYPYRDDGREALDADVSIRRVLRGGCFSSNRMKACCTYRGSLEPNGFWRGNGFRVVVSSSKSLLPGFGGADSV